MDRTLSEAGKEKLLQQMRQDKIPVDQSKVTKEQLEEQEKQKHRICTASCAERPGAQGAVRHDVPEEKDAQRSLDLPSTLQKKVLKEDEKTSDQPVRITEKITKEFKKNEMMTEKEIEKNLQGKNLLNHGG